MSLFGSLLGAGVSFLGSRLSQRQTERGSQAALAASSPFSVSGPFGSSQVQGQQINQSLGPELSNAFGLFSGLTTGPQQSIQVPGLERPTETAAGLDRLAVLLGNADVLPSEQQRLAELRNIARPGEERALASTRSQVFNQGRLGLGVGGGVTGAQFNPELASLQEGLARADLSRVQQARQDTIQDRARRFNEEFAAQGLFSGLRDEQRRATELARLDAERGFRRRLASSAEARNILGVPMRASQIGIAAAAPQGIAAMQAAPFAQGARSTESFFSGLGQGIADSGLFGGGGTASTADTSGGFDLFPEGLFGR